MTPMAALALLLAIPGFARAREPTDAEVKAQWYVRNPTCGSQTGGDAVLKALFPDADLAALAREDRNPWNRIPEETLEACAAALWRDPLVREALLRQPATERWDVLKAFANGTSARSIFDGSRIETTAYALVDRDPEAMLGNPERLLEFARIALRAPHDARTVNEIEDARLIGLADTGERVLRVDIRTKIRIRLYARLYLRLAKDTPAYLSLRLIESVTTPKGRDRSRGAASFKAKIGPVDLPLPGSWRLVRLNASVIPTKWQRLLARDEDLRWGVEWRAEFTLKNLRRALGTPWPSTR